jgi:hypothetical protein
MKDLVDYVNTFYGGASQKEKDRANEILKTLFFEYINKPFKRFESSNEYKFAMDLRKIRSVLIKPNPSFRKIKIGSTLLRENIKEIQEYLLKDRLEEFEINYIKREFLIKYRPYEDAIYIASIIYHDKRIETSRWWIGGVFGFLGGLLINNLDQISKLVNFSTGVIQKIFK